eukprot:441767-Rhodomonas_salina.8
MSWYGHTRRSVPKSLGTIFIGPTSVPETTHSRIAIEQVSTGSNKVRTGEYAQQDGDRTCVAEWTGSSSIAPALGSTPHRLSTRIDIRGSSQSHGPCQHRTAPSKRVVAHSRIGYVTVVSTGHDLANALAIRGFATWPC